MTLEEAIKHAEEVANSHDRKKRIKAVTLEECRCAEEHRQIAEWLKELKEFRERTRWIPCSKRSPEDRQIVLFCDIDDDIMIGYHVKGRPDTHFSQDGTFMNMKNIRAWMPLPDVYKEEG